ncbi:MAG: MarR family transcriptional regulator [Methylotenera sp.]|nr:MarR family transcriptional regulator [Methylotenera sp.]
MNTLSSSSYIKFLNLAKAIRELTAFPCLNPMEECLLNYVALSWQADKNLSVSETMHSNVAMTPSSVHRHLKSLRIKGFLSLTVDERDNRIKYITHTPLSEQYFSMLEKCISQTANS